MTWVRTALATVFLAALLGCASAGSREVLPFNGLESPPKSFSGVLTLPKDAKAPIPVVVLVHGTAGADSRIAFHRSALIAAGIGTFEVDFKTGVFTEGADRPPIAAFHPWAFGALKVLRAHPAVDADRIAIMGFSMGGHLGVSVAARAVVARWMGPGQPGFAAHVGFYPVCQGLETYFDASGAAESPILIVAGELDAWGDGETCPQFAGWLNGSRSGTVSLTVYPKVHHGFDREGAWQGYAPYARNRKAILEWNAEAAYDSRQRAVAFLQKAFGR